MINPIYEFRLPLPPSANVYWRKTNRGIVYVSAEAKAFRSEAFILGRNAGCVPLLGDIWMDFEFWFINKSADGSNRIKVLEDALQGVCYNDDVQIVDEHWHKYFVPDKKKPRKGEPPAPPRVGYVIVRVNQG